MQKWLTTIQTIVNHECELCPTCPKIDTFLSKLIKKTECCCWYFCWDKTFLIKNKIFFSDEVYFLDRRASKFSVEDTGFLAKFRSRALYLERRKIFVGSTSNIKDLSKSVVSRLLRQCEQVRFDWGDQPLGDSLAVALDSGISTL